MAWRWLSPLNPPVREWRGQRVWVVGASSGIGRATASALHARGAQVWASARSEQALASFTASHPGSHALPLEVSDRLSVRTAAHELMHGGPPDLVVYCAGHFRPQRATTFDLDEMLRHQEVNYVGALHVLDTVLPAMLRRGRGHVSLVSSVAGYRGLPTSLAYGPTKAALINLAQALYMDLHPRGLAVSVVNPGFVRTPLTEQNDFRMPALIDATEAALEMVNGWERGRFEIHYPRRFTMAMKLLSVLPFRMYHAAVKKVTGL